VTTSPWGAIETQVEIKVVADLPPLVSVQTSGHGGVFVPDELLGVIPLRHQLYAEYWSGSRNWYEEDVAIYAVMAAFPGAFPEFTHKTANDIIEHYVTQTLGPVTEYRDIRDIPNT